jgi:hypothetical protein
MVPAGHGGERAAASTDPQGAAVSARRLLAFAAALAVTAAACSDHTGPTLSSLPDAPAAVLGAPSVSVAGLLQFAEIPDLTGTRQASKRILAAEGGFVELHGFRVDIPAGALPADTTVTITLPSDPLLGKRLMAEFEPHGVQFSTPATLSFPLAGVVLGGGPIGVARWENGAWNDIGGAVSGDGKVLSATTPHFSAYGGKYIMAGG